MRLEITNPNDELSREFALWLCNEIVDMLETRLNPAKLVRWDEYLDNVFSESKLTATKLSAANILCFGAKNLQCLLLPSKIIIQLPALTYVPNLDRVRLSSVIRMITFGTRDISGYPILANIMQQIADNLETYVNRYYGVF